MDKLVSEKIPTSIRNMLTENYIIRQKAPM